MRKMIKVSLLMMLILGLVGCTGFKENSYKTEFVSGSAYNVGMSSISNLQQAGTITADIRAKVNTQAFVFYRSWPVAVDALVAYAMAEGQETQAMVNIAITQLFKNWTDLAALINSIAPNTVPTSTMTLKGKGAGGEETTVTIKKLSDGTLSVIVQIGSMIVQFVLPEISKVVSVISQKTVTLEEIRALKTLIKAPDQY